MNKKGRPPISVRAEVELFAALYVYVTRDLRHYGKLLHREDRIWLRKLVNGFSARYRSWDAADLQTYFSILHANGVNKHLKLAGHVFLHIAFDLPRTIANSLHPATVTSKNSYMLEQLNRRRLAYVAISPRFPDIMDTFLRQHALGRAVAATRLGRSAMELITFWAIAMRTVAWVHAEVLAGAANREELERRILTSMENAVRVATTRGLVGVPGMHVMGLRSLLMPTVALQGGPPAGESGWAMFTAAIAAALAAATGYFLVRDYRKRSEEDLMLRDQLMSLRNTVEHLISAIEAERASATSQLAELRTVLKSVTQDQSDSLHAVVERMSDFVQISERSISAFSSDRWEHMQDTQMRMLSEMRDLIGELVANATPALQSTFDDAEERETLARINIFGLLLHQQITDTLRDHIGQKGQAG